MSDLVAADNRLGLGGVLLICGVVLLRSAAWVNRMGHASRVWPTVRGRVLAKSVRQGGRCEPRFVAVVRYEYEVGGRTYRGRRVRWWVAPSGTRRDQVANRVSRFRAGRSVRVYYYPRWPRVVVLEPGTEWAHLGARIWGGALLAGAGLLLVATA